RRRSKFDPKRRQEVKAVRSKRACLRCALLHIPCSHHNICSPCQQLALRLYEKQTLSFSACVRTMPSEVSIFAASGVTDYRIGIWSHKTQDDLATKSQKLALVEITLDFSSQMTWDLSHLVDDMIHWLNHPILSETSKVGTLSSPQFFDLIKPFIDELARTDFHRMIYAISLAYTQPDSHDFSIPELYQVGDLAGHRFLKRLDKLLKPQQLKSCSGDELRVLFLLVIGTILAVGYMDLSISNKDFKDGAEFKDMQSFLCQILAHYVIYLGSQLKLPMASGADQFILEAASARWHKQGSFQW
ncbi:hypothetical protein BGZ57DRAFT_743686, partial [Hyaloscypha finlandica]